MSFGELSNSDRDVIRRSLAACADGPFFEDWEFRTLFGLTRSEFREAACSWDGHEAVDPRLALAIHNAAGAFLGYPHGMDGELELSFGLSRSQIAELFRRWRTR